MIGRSAQIGEAVVNQFDCNRIYFLTLVTGHARATKQKDRMRTALVRAGQPLRAHRVRLPVIRIERVGAGSSGARIVGSQLLSVAVGFNTITVANVTPDIRSLPHLDANLPHWIMRAADSRLPLLDRRHSTMKVSDDRTEKAMRTRES